MTLRHRLFVAALSVGLAAGGLAAAPVPAAQASARPAPIVNDPLAGVASMALDEAVTYLRTGDRAALTEFDTTRDVLAGEIAGRLGLAPELMRDAWRAADSVHQRALVAALSQLGVPYRRNSSSAGFGFDCSGLTTYAWGEAGATLVRQSGAQMKRAAPRTRVTAQAGDLVYYPGHVMMYLGAADAVVHAPHPGRTVEVTFVTKSRVHSVKYGDPVG